MRVKQKHLLSATFASGQKRVVGSEEKQEARRSSVSGGKRQPGADGRGRSGTSNEGSGQNEQG